MIAKISVLPAGIATMAGDLENIANCKLQWQLVVQATGVGALRLDGESNRLSAAVEQLPLRCGGPWRISRALAPAKALVLLDAWGNPGDALQLTARGAIGISIRRVR